MKNWNLKIQNSPQEIIEKLKSAFASAGGFIFNVDEESALFNIRKPVKYPDQILHRNRIIVNGSLLNGTTENKTDVEISFVQDFYMKMTVISIIIFGGILIALLSRISSAAAMYLLGGLVLVIGLVLWLALQKKLKKDTEQYKTLISEILASK